MLCAGEVDGRLCSQTLRVWKKHPSPRYDPASPPRFRWHWILDYSNRNPIVAEIAAVNTAPPGVVAMSTGVTPPSSHRSRVRWRWERVDGVERWTVTCLKCGQVTPDLSEASLAKRLDQGWARRVREREGVCYLGGRAPVAVLASDDHEGWRLKGSDNDLRRERSKRRVQIKRKRSAERPRPSTSS